MSATSKYTIGYVLSVALTLIAFALVSGRIVMGAVLLGLLAVLAIVQLAVQLICFLHLGQEERPRWKAWSFVAMFAVLSIVVGGSLWIMQNLDYNMMSPMDTDQHMIKEGNKGF